MSTCGQIVKRYKNVPTHQIQELWCQMLKSGVKSDYLRDILMLYMQHRMLPPPEGKVYDTLLLLFTSKKTCRKIKNVIFHILEEVCSCLESSIVETVCLSPSNAATVELFNCLLVGGFVTLLDKSCLGQLLGELADGDPESRGKLLAFLCQVVASYPGLLTSEQLASISLQCSKWLSCTAPGGSEAQLFTVLTPCNTWAESQMMSIHAFSSLRAYLERGVNGPGPLADAAREYCNAVAEQNFQTAARDADVLHKAVLCEVVDVLTRLVQLEPSQGSHSLQLVKRIHAHTRDSFRSDHRDISIMVRTLHFLLNYGEGYSPQHLCEQFLGDVLSLSYSSSLAAWDIAQLLCDNHDKLANLLVRFFPNVLKLVACHPAAVIEEFLLLVPTFVAPHVAVELFCSLLDLPVVSASICLHQTPVLQQQFSPLLERFAAPTLHPTFTFMLRSESASVQPSVSSLQVYLQALGDLTTHPLVDTCCTVAPLLLQAFLAAVEGRPDLALLSSLLPAMLGRVRLIYAVPGYSEAVCSMMAEHLTRMLKRCPELVVTNQADILGYVSILDNCLISFDMYTCLVWAVGEYASLGYSHDTSLRYFEPIECILYEALVQMPLQEASFKLLNLLCATLAKLASRCEDLIPRVVLCLGKVAAQMQEEAPTSFRQHRKVVAQRVNQLISVLTNPSIAWAVLSPPREDNPAMTAMLGVLSQLSTS